MLKVIYHYISCPASSGGQYEGTREGFEYEPEHDRWKCRNGKYVTFKKIKYQKDQPEKHYLTTRFDCKGCPYTKECLGKSKEKRIRITLYKPEYDRAKVRVESSKGRIMKKKRQSTVEPVFGTLMEYMGMRKVGVRGLEQANKVMLMAGTAYNLKKLIHYAHKSWKTEALRQKLAAKCHYSLISNLLFYLIRPVFEHSRRIYIDKNNLLEIIKPRLCYIA